MRQVTVFRRGGEVFSVLCVVGKVSSCTRVMHFVRELGGVCGNQLLKYRNCFQMLGSTLLQQQYLMVLRKHVLISLLL